jgi:isopenicillin N synthase-like dioxygenase
MADHLVPTVDISAPTDSMLSELDQACIDHGFFLLSGHGLDELIEQTWQSPSSSSLVIVRASWQ